LMFNADKVPVGEDQVQHLEYARDIAQKFNRMYGNILQVPAQVVQKLNANVPGLDGRKMSKSYENVIPLFEEPARLKKLVARIKTDSLPPEAPKSTEGSILFELYQSFASPEQIEALRAKFAAGISYGAAKEELFQVMDAHLTPGREKYKQLMADKGELDRLLREGASRAREVVAANLVKIRKAIGIQG
jgi:tryptophanyl-tRNA synthetase